MTGDFLLLLLLMFWGFFFPFFGFRCAGRMPFNSPYGGQVTTSSQPPHTYEIRVSKIFSFCFCFQVSYFSDWAERPFCFFFFLSCSCALNHNNCFIVCGVSQASLSPPPISSVDKIRRWLQQQFLMNLLVGRRKKVLYILLLLCVAIKLQLIFIDKFLLSIFCAVVVVAAITENQGKAKKGKKTKPIAFLPF